MRKPVRVVASVIITLGCAVMVLLAASQMTMAYYLPPREPGGEATRHVTTFGPAVVAMGVTVVLTVVSVGWLVWNLVRTPPTKLWAAAVLVLVAAVVTAALVQAAPRPTF